MKHNLRITIILLILFLTTQIIGLAVVNFYLNNQIPYGFDQSQNIQQTDNFYLQVFLSFISAFVIAILIAFFLMKRESIWFIRIWFFIVVALALGITINVLIGNILYSNLIALTIGAILSYIKTFKKNIIVHNLTELLIYPGIAAIFVSMLNLKFTIILLILISIYDMWAVWKSGIMQKMAKFQMNSVVIFSGFLITYADKKTKNKIRLLKQKYKNNIPQNILKKSKLKISMAILGGGDIIFPIVA